MHKELIYQFAPSPHGSHWQRKIRLSKLYSESMKNLLVFLLGLTTISNGMAQIPYDWAVGSAHVISIEATYMPAAIRFATDVNAGSCGAGIYLTWSGAGPDATSQQSNAKAIFGLLVAAKISNATITIYGTNSGCAVKYIYLQ